MKRERERERKNIRSLSCIRMYRKRRAAETGKGEIKLERCTKRERETKRES